MHQSADDRIEDFAGEARHYTDWARDTTRSGMTAPVALRRIISLYSSALALPPHHGDASPGTVHRVEIEAHEVRKIYDNACTLPLRHYGEVFDPAVLPPEAPVVGDIADDIADIYRDVAKGLRLYEQGLPDAAHWQWSYSLKIHWGEHATGAIRALHAYLSRENEEGLSARL